MTIAHQQCSRLARLAGRVVMRLGRWRCEGEVPNVPRMVVIAAPHTSNWDLIYMLAAAFQLGLSVNWLGKNSLFRGPLGAVLRYFGGLPVDRSKPNQLIVKLAGEINQRATCALVVPPEGTRAHTDHWKSGFYWIAVEANVPMVLAYLDWSTRRCGIGPTLVPTGNVADDMDKVREFYQDMRGRFPAQTSTIRLRDESAGPDLDRAASG